jgi:hypothetical protein
MNRRLVEFVVRREVDKEKFKELPFVSWYRWHFHYFDYYPIWPADLPGAR